MKTFALTSLLLLTPIVAQPVMAQSANTQALDHIVAVVEDSVVLNSELNQAIKNIETQYANQPGRLPPRHILEKQVLERLIVTKLQVERAKRGGITVSDSELDATINNIARRNNVSREQLQANLRNDGMDYATFRRNVREEMTIQRLQQGIAQSRVNVTDSEVDLLLESQAKNASEVRLGNILVALPDGATPEQIEIAQKKINGIAKVIAEEQITFEAAAIRFSDAPDALEGGLTDWRDTNTFPPQLVAMLNSMSVGDVSQPLRTPAGYVLIKLSDKREPNQSTETITQYNTDGIMVAFDKYENEAEAEAQIRKLHQRLANGDEFAEIAREYSDDTINKAKGGDMGWINAYAYGTAVGDVISNMTAGELSEPFKSESGWHVIRVKETRQQNAADANARARAREMIGNRKAEEEYKRFVREMRAEAFVDVLVPGLGMEPKEERSTTETETTDG